MASRVEEIDDLNFESEVLASELPYLLDFGATWCAPCRALAPLIEELAEQMRGGLRVGKVDMENAPAVAARFQVLAAPTLLLFHGGRVVERRVGLPTRKALRELVESTAPAASAVAQPIAPAV